MNFRTIGRTIGRSIGLLSAALVFIAAQSALAVETTITKISDGDTVHVANPDGGKDLKIRMLNMDTPELHLVEGGKTYDQGHWAQDASDYLEKLAPIGSKVDLQAEGTDKYGRTLGRLFKGSTDLNLELVAAGLAVPYLICDGAGCDADFLKRNDARSYVEACRTAEREGRGIFSPDDPLTELPFEFRLRIQNRKADKFVGDIDTGTYVRPADYKRVETCNRIFFMTEKDASHLGFKPAR